MSSNYHGAALTVAAALASTLFIALTTSFTAVI